MRDILRGPEKIFLAPSKLQSVHDGLTASTTCSCVCPEISDSNCAGLDFASSWKTLICYVLFPTSSMRLTRQLECHWTQSFLDSDDSSHSDQAVPMRVFFFALQSEDGKLQNLEIIVSNRHLYATQPSRHAIQEGTTLRAENIHTNRSLNL